MPSRALTVLLAVAGGYVAAQVLSDIASLKIVEIAGFAVDAGTLIYPFTFTLRDLVHKIAGKTAARVLIVTAAVVNLGMALLFWVTARLPAADTAPQTVLFGDVLSPVWGIVVASILAEVVSELIDTEVYAAWVRRLGERHQWGRVLSSNAMAIPVDSAVFVGVAVLTGVFPTAVAWSIFWVNVVVKGVVTLVSIPWIYLVSPQPLFSSETT
ncbi:MAG TPA: queuosine precursor transporter [Acidimicrobiia bacterium]|nr:queuosine precursor transporter [Acidimicrobiia bacterium]